MTCSSPRHRVVLPLLLCGLCSLSLAAQAGTGQALKWVNLRAGPARDYPLIAQFPPGSVLDIQGCTAGYGWCDVIGPSGARGWIYAGNIADSTRDTPLLGYGASFGIPVIGFMIGDYWGSYYQNRPWYGRQEQWRGRDVPSDRPPPRPMPRQMPQPNRPAALPQAQHGSPPAAPGQIRPRGAAAAPDVSRSPSGPPAGFTQGPRPPAGMSTGGGRPSGDAPQGAGGHAQGGAPQGGGNRAAGAGGGGQPGRQNVHNGREGGGNR